MDTILRNRMPENAYDAKILRDRQTDDRREDLRRHLKDETTRRLNNSWYSRQQAHGSPSPSSNLERPYGMLADMYGELPTMRRPGERSPVRPSRTSHSPVGIQESSFMTNSSRGETSSHFDGSMMKPEFSGISIRGEQQQSVHHDDKDEEDEMRFHAASDPLRVSRASYAADSSNFARRESFSSQEDEYAASKSSAPISQMRRMKVREFNGNQVAQLLGYAPFTPQPPMDPSLSPLYNAELGEALQQQIRNREEASRRNRSADIRAEDERVRQTIAEARARIAQEEETRLDKQKEAMRLLQESERLAHEALQQRRAREIAEEEAARAEREEMERKRLEEIRLRKRLVENKLEQINRLVDPVQTLTSSLPPNSPLVEAVRRLLDAHENELDDIAPIIQDILNEPEFSGTPWY